MPRRKQKHHEKQEPNPQKFSWKKKSTHKSFESADKKREKLKEEGVEHVKIRRCGPDGSQFKVVIGSPLAKKKGKK